MVTFRLAKEKDLENIVNTYNASIPSRMATADLEPVSVESKQSWFREHRADKRPVWIVLYNKQYAGWMSFSSFYGRPAYDASTELSLYLERKFQGMGIGKICVRYALEQAPRFGINNVMGFIFAHNEASLRLFYSFGFERWALLPDVAELDGIKRDLVIVGKKI
ncbi:MAG TPA: N-acetyltransferase family protein [Bacteroidia bacterium]|nr:N-acetyltransferase family protein [Bacteroidia bacterium]